MRDILNLKEAAKFIGVCDKTLSFYVKENKIPCKRIGKKFIFSRQAILDWLTSPVKMVSKPVSVGEKKGEN